MSLKTNIMDLIAKDLHLDYHVKTDCYFCDNGITGKEFKRLADKIIETVIQAQG
jgi:hypothetical protein